MQLNFIIQDCKVNSKSFTIYDIKLVVSKALRDVNILK